MEATSEFPDSATFSVDRRPSTAAAGPATSSGWERRDIRAESMEGVTAVTLAIRHGLQSMHCRWPAEIFWFLCHRSAAPKPVPVTRPAAVPDEEHDAAPPDRSVYKTYSFVALPGNAVKRRPR